MAMGALDSAIFADMFGTAPMREVFGDDAFLARCIEVEAALARAQARLGVIPPEAADAISHTANALASGREALDLARLKNQNETVGYPILPPVRQIAEFAGAALGGGAWATRRSPGTSSATALPKPSRSWRCWPAVSARSPSM